MKLLPLFLIPLSVSATNCYQYGTITQCDNGVTAYQFGNQTQINLPNGSTQTIYQLGNVTMIDGTHNNLPIIPVIPSIQSPSMLDPFH